MKTSVSLRDQVVTGLLAGAAGAILIDVFLFVVQLVQGVPLGAVVGATFGWIASVMLGPSAAGNPAAPAIGLVLHFCISVGWAIGYVYAARSQPQLVRRPWISGAIFGLVVFGLTQLVLLASGQYVPPVPAALDVALIAQMVFYGIPVALIVSRRVTRPTAHA